VKLAKEIDAARAIFGLEKPYTRNTRAHFFAVRAHQVFIIDNERWRPFRPGPHARDTRPAGNTFFRGGFFGRGEPDAERAAGAGGRFSTSICPWWLRAMPSAAARPRPRPVNLVLKKRVEDLGARVASSMPHPGVTHFDTDVAPNRGIRSPIERGAFRGALMTCTVPAASPIASPAFKDQVHHQLLDLRGVGLNGWQLIRPGPAKNRTFLGRGGAHQLANLTHES